MLSQKNPNCDGYTTVPDGPGLGAEDSFDAGTTSVIRIDVEG